MTVRIELKPEVAANVVAQAEARGLSVEEYVQQVIEDRAGVQPTRKATAEEIEAMLDELAEMGKDLPPLSDYALTRESIYEDHD
jgi:hypothetical protein